MSISKIILISILCSNYVLINSFINLSFTYINKKTGENKPSTSNITNYFESLFSNPIYTTLNINNKNIKFHITMDRYATYISEKTFLEIEPKSANVDSDENVYSLEYIGIYRAIYKNSSLSLLLDKPKNISFFMVKNMINTTELDLKTNCYAKETEEIGMNIYKGNKLKKVLIGYDPDDYLDFGGDDYYKYLNNNKEKKIFQNNGYKLEEKTNLIYQLKAQKIILSYSFFIKYDNQKDEKGQIIIGGLPHEYDPKHYNIKNYIYNLVSLDKEETSWGTTLNSIKYGENILRNGQIGEISIDYGFIITSIYNKELLDQFFFKNSKYIDYCYEEKIGLYTVKYCKEKVIREFKKLNFYLKLDYNDNKNNILEFDYKDLFIKANENDDIYYFQIIFQYRYYKWLFGRPLFKKYSMVFDQDKKLFGFYTQTGEYSNNENKPKKEFFFVFILIIILFTCFFCFIFY